jgi:hypothetical protein
VSHLEAARAEFQRRLRERLGRKPVEPAGPPPRYDEIYAEGVAWLDELAGCEPREDT